MLVNHSGATLHEILDAVAKVNDIIAKINAASNQQASGLAQISAAVTQMDTNTRDNATMVEQATAAAAAMSEQTRHLLESVSAFNVAPSAPAASAASQPRNDNAERARAAAG
jgi:methyl-accepting chemotaxis protein